MALFYRYQSATISTYNTSSSVRSETVTKPFSPFVPKYNSGDGYSDEYVGKKKLVPVGRRPYEYESDDEWKHERGTNPAHRAYVDPPPSSIPVTLPHSGHSSQPIPYVTKPNIKTTPDYYADHGDYGTKEKYKPKPASTPVYADGYGTDNGDYNNKERYKSKPTSGPAYNDGYGADYGDYNNKERYKSKPTFNPVYNDGYGADYGDYNNKERYRPKPTFSPVYHDGYGTDDGDYNNKERYKPKSTVVPVYNDGYGAKPSGTPVYNDGYGADYGDYNNREGYNPKPKPSDSSVYNDRYGADYGSYNNKEGYKPKSTGIPFHNNGYGDNYGTDNGKERSTPKPIESPVYNDGYGGDYGNYSKGPKPKSTEIPVYNDGYGVGGASPTGHDYGGYGNYPNNKERNKLVGPKTIETPRKGTPLSKPMNDINEALELLKKEAAVVNGNEKNMNLVDETEKLKKIATKAPETPAKGNSRFSSQRPLFNFSDGRRPDYGVIDHKEAEKKFKGMTI
ncbi:hypothetical protein DEO72_LG9g2413 [Vigna unguiculata]|uniref:Uncharacterized protein n=1 Tax=Vigna unguiculata TaxID=3917 RepID=A0A4D6N3E9_VIGUN|nr:hypothetical protein DEO72_LG9g2413 [Vigna unguiculata]